MTGHTPGPWSAAERGDYSDFDGDSCVILGNDRRIAIVQHNGSIEDEANAALIAAAPALLEALERIRYMAGSPHGYTIGDVWQAQEQAEAAIALAKAKPANDAAPDQYITQTGRLKR